MQGVQRTRHIQEVKDETLIGAECWGLVRAVLRVVLAS